MRINRLLLSLALLTTSAVPQQSVHSPSDPPADSASLDDTMKFIQDKLNAVGNVNYAAHWHDYGDGTDGLTQYSFKQSNVAADPASCWIKYHLKIVTGTGLNDRDNGLYLPDVQDLVVTTGEQYANKHFLEGQLTLLSLENRSSHLLARGSKTGKDEPALGVAKAGENVFVFTDEETANRVAKAMLHAVELCGGAKGSETVQNGAGSSCKFSHNSG